MFVRVSFQSLDNARAIGEPVTGRFVVPPDASGRRGTAGWVIAGRDLRFQWGGDTAARDGGSTRPSAG